MVIFIASSPVTGSSNALTLVHFLLSLEHHTFSSSLHSSGRIYVRTCFPAMAILISYSIHHFLGSSGSNSPPRLSCLQPGSWTWNDGNSSIYFLIISVASTECKMITQHSWGEKVDWHLRLNCILRSFLKPNPDHSLPITVILALGFAHCSGTIEFGDKWLNNPSHWQNALLNTMPSQMFWPLKWIVWPSPYLAGYWCCLPLCQHSNMAVQLVPRFHYLLDDIWWARLLFSLFDPHCSGSPPIIAPILHDLLLDVLQLLSYVSPYFGL